MKISPLLCVLSIFASAIADENVSMCDLASSCRDSQGGPGWNCDGHVPKTSLCSWIGVECQSGAVFGISIHNRCVGQLPSTIGDITTLQYLDISLNVFTGSVPTTIANMLLLQHLDIGGNRFTGPITTITSVVTLQYLDLSGNTFTGSIPTTIELISTLEYLDISWNSLTGNIPSAIENLTTLQHFEMGGNLFSGSLPFIGSMTALSYLGFSKNHIADYLPFSIGSLTALQFANLAGNRFWGFVPSGIGGATALSYLDLSNNALIGSLPSSIGSLTSLSYLMLYGNRFGGSPPSTLGSLTALLYFDASYNGLSGSLPISIGSLTSLSDLILNGNNLVRSIPSTIGSLTALSMLNLANNLLSGSLPSSIGSMISLSYMILNGNRIGGSLPFTIGELSALLFLDLSNNMLSGSLPSSVGNLISLSECALLSNSLTGSLPSTIGSLTALSYFDMSLNSMAGSFPSSIGGMSSMTRLFLNYNCFSGSLPSSFGDMSSLVEVYLHHNQLTGTLPSTLGKLASIETFYLHENILTGKLPMELAQCKELSVMAVDGTNMTITKRRLEQICTGIPDLGLFLTNALDVNVCSEISPSNPQLSLWNRLYHNTYVRAFTIIGFISLCIVGFCVKYKRKILRKLRSVFGKPDTSQVFLTHDWGEDELGRNNHDRVALINSDLKKHRMVTWFDADRLSGDVLSQMTSGIDNTQSVVVFITERYMNKVNSDDNRDNCKFEFEYAFRTLGSSRIIPVVMEPRMRNTRNWKGVFGGSLGGLLYVDMTSDDPKEFASRMTELRKRIVLNINDLEEVTTVWKKNSTIHPADNVSLSTYQNSVKSKKPLLYSDFFLSHDWGTDSLQRDNHDRVHVVNDMLQSRNVTTWFDSERLSGNVIAQMTDGIDNTGKMVVFVTERYMNKVNSEDSRDNCKIEFEYAFRRLGARGIIPVVMEPHMLNKSNWKGVFDGAIGGRQFLDFTSDDKLASVCDQLSEYCVPSIQRVEGETPVEVYADEMMEVV